MRRLALAALFAPVVFACGSDENGAPRYLVAQGCPTTQGLRPRAVANEDMAVSKLAEKVLVLTFDNGPSAATTTISQYLAGQGIRATFFLNGTNAAAQTSIVDQTGADGHLLANRTTMDDDITGLPAADLVKSIADVDEILKTRTAATKLFFRSPYGHWNAAAFNAVSASEMNKYIGPIGWDIGTALDATTGSDVGCWDEENGTKTVEECGNLFLLQIRDKKKGIVLMHDGGVDQSKTAEMLQVIIPILKTEGFTFKRLDEVKLLPASKTFGENEPPGTGGGTEGGDGTGDDDDSGPCPTTP